MSTLVAIFRSILTIIKYRFHQLLGRLVYPAALSCAALGLLLGLFSEERPGVSLARLWMAIRGASAVFILFYAVAQIAQAALRAWRAKILVRSSVVGGSIPDYRHFFWITLARNMFVDMLPARLGELSYVGMLNRGHKVSAEACLSSLFTGLLFDFLALLMVLIFAIPAATQSSGFIGSFILLGIICAIGYVGLFRWFPRIITAIQHRVPAHWLRIRPLSAALDLAQRTANSIGFVSAARVLPAVLWISAGIRVVKYAGLYGLYLAVTRTAWPELGMASPWAILIALIAAEGAASLPIPTFMSFGTYEAGGLLALSSLGFNVSDSIIVLLALHIISQMMDYGFGTLAFAVYTLSTPAHAAPQKKERDAPALTARSRTISRVLLSLVVLLAALVFLGQSWRSLRKRGAVFAPDKGVPVLTTEGIPATARGALKSVDGDIVWSSNRAGQHDLWLLTLPEAKERRLTHHPHTDTYPRFSPDGTRVAFCRSQIPWVSQRNPEPWDTYILELATGAETLVATNAFTPAWSADGKSLVFVRNGVKLMRVSTDTTAPQTPVLIAEAGRDPFPNGTQITTPYPGPDGETALTLRGRLRMQAILGNDGSLRSAGGGCQLNWSGDGQELLCVDKGKRGGNAIFRVDPQTLERKLLLDVEGSHSHEYFPRLSQDQRWLVFAASESGHEHDTADYEIFLWRTNGAMDAPIRLTYHTANDNWPDIHLKADKD